MIATKRGFTLIEILVALTISCLIMVFVSSIISKAIYMKMKSDIYADITSLANNAIQHSILDQSISIQTRNKLFHQAALRGWNLSIKREKDDQYDYLDKLVVNIYCPELQYSFTLIRLIQRVS